MLREIVEFTKSLDSEIFFRNLKPSEGLHIMIWLTEEGLLEKYEYDIYKKNLEITPLLKECLYHEIYSKCVSMNKALDSKKKIHSCSPFTVAFKLKTFNAGELESRYNEYFKSALTYCTTAEQKNKVIRFNYFFTTMFTELLNTIFTEIDEKGKKDKKYKLKEGHYIHIYLGNIELDDYKTVHMNYLRPKVFNKEKFNIIKDSQIFGVSDYLTGFNEKKPFLQHNTATFNLNFRVNEDDALWLYRFSQLKANNQLPNPLPIFIDKRELNQEVVTLFLKKEGKISFSDIIRSIYEKYEDLGNYYLLNIYGKAIKDFDFVSSFKLYLNKKIHILPLFTDGGNLANKIIENIFDFERLIVQKIFNNQLINITKNGIRFRYFDDIEYKPQFISATEYRLVLKYRKAFYDYICKSKREAVNSRIFHEIMRSIILDEIKHDDQHNKKSFSIKEKLNIWFSLYEFFNHPFKKGDLGIMANLTIRLRKRMQEIVDSPDDHINDDNEFAFAAGQIIFYLLGQSETANKTHALLEPFLQKTDCDQFKMAISRMFERYKHKIHLNHRRFNKLASEVLGFSTNENIKNLLPIILAGYFSDNILYGKKADQIIIEE